jgi:hypothetical protein
MRKIYLRQALMHVWVQQSAEAFKFKQYVISIVFVFWDTLYRVSKKNAMEIQQAVVHHKLS